MKVLKKQGYNARLDEALGMRNMHAKHMGEGFHARRSESKAMEKKYSGHPYAGDKGMDKGMHKKKMY